METALINTYSAGAYILLQTDFTAETDNPDKAKVNQYI